MWPQHYRSSTNKETKCSLLLIKLNTNKMWKFTQCLPHQVIFASKALWTKLAKKVSLACVNHKVSPYIFTRKETPLTVITSEFAICWTLHCSGSCMNLNTQTAILHYYMPIMFSILQTYVTTRDITAYNMTAYNAYLCQI